MLRMPTFHLAALRGSVVNATTNTAIAGVPDQALARSASGNFLAPDGINIRYGTTGGVNISRSRVNTPSLREVALPYIAPVNTGITIPSPPNMSDFGPVGIVPRTADEISVESTHTDAAPQIMWALLWMIFTPVQQSMKREYRTRFTATITGSVGTWQSGAITLDQTLPAGVYQVTGMDVFGTNLIAARLIFPGAPWRPGVLARNAVSSIAHPLGTDGRLGVFGEFNSTAPPQLETYVEAANTAQEGYLDLVRVGDYSPASI